MKNRKRIIMLLNAITAILFFLAALIGKNYVFIPIGCCFLTLGIVNGNGHSGDKDSQ